jgi:hypothetical protein
LRSIDGLLLIFTDWVKLIPKLPISTVLIF